jgi:hypothetical protein
MSDGSEELGDLSNEEVVTMLAKIAEVAGINRLTACIEGEDDQFLLIQFGVSLHDSLEEAQASIELKPINEAANDGTVIH